MLNMLTNPPYPLKPEVKSHLALPARRPTCPPPDLPADFAPEPSEAKSHLAPAAPVFHLGAVPPGPDPGVRATAPRKVHTRQCPPPPCHSA